MPISKQLIFWYTNRQHSTAFAFCVTSSFELVRRNGVWQGIKQKIYSTKDTLSHKYKKVCRQHVEDVKQVLFLALWNVIVYSHFTIYEKKPSCMYIRMLPCIHLYAYFYNIHTLNA